MSLRQVTAGVLVCGSHVRLGSAVGRALVACPDAQRPVGTDAVGLCACHTVAAQSSARRALFVRYAKWDECSCQCEEPGSTDAVNRGSKNVRPAMTMTRLRAG